MSPTAHWTRKLDKLEACREAVEWAEQHKTLDAAWDACQLGYWVLWLMFQIEPPDASRAAFSFADQALQYAAQALRSAADSHPDTKHQAALREHADRLDAIPPITAQTCGVARAAAWAAGAAAWDAAWASGDAAGAAGAARAAGAAGAAAWDAAWAARAAGAAGAAAAVCPAWAAAWASGDASWAARAAGAARAAALAPGNAQLTPQADWLRENVAPPSLEAVHA